MIDKLKWISKNNNGLIYTKDVTQYNIRKEVLSDLVKSGDLVRLKRGVYCFKDEIIDEYYLFQLKAPQLIYSLGTALFFHGYSNRVPNVLSITVKQGYNVHRIDTKKINARYSSDELFELGLTAIKSPQGMEVRCYDLERTICDIIKERNKMDPQIFSDAINQYFSNKKINSRLLMKYAKAMKIEDEIMKYIEVLR
ncbi:type IV toxin-antitoxin system AbiEi family antitoxin domain-containing protein [Erysipelothrix rhusiopathiae]|uniref:type IV toxin-antitoxin system AbiEi family antitoxin domain-containing protein n=1 Tax=Erysipelothrix rhusiopathiae TaxID=1648 RepID=UPI003BF58EEA